MNKEKCKYNLEEKCVLNCSPAIFGAKPSNLFTCCNKDCPNLDRQIKDVRRTLKKFSIDIEEIRCNNGNILFFVYKKSLIENVLKNKAIKKFLFDFGYPVEKNINTNLAVLFSRLKNNRDFPHEIGVFLGYPLKDVKAYIDKSLNHKAIGAWKVYTNTEAAKETFKKYKLCKLILGMEYSRGNNLEEILNKIYKENNIYEKYNSLLECNRTYRICC